MKRNGVKTVSFLWIWCDKAPLRLSIVPGSQIIEPHIGVQLLTGVKVDIWRDTSGRRQYAKRIVGVPVCHPTGWIGQLSGRLLSVILVKTCARTRASLVNQIMTEGVGDRSAVCGLG